MPRTRMDDLVEELGNIENKEGDVVSEKARSAKKKFQQTDLIMCRSVTNGGLFLEGSKTKQLYKWNDYGDETEVEYRDLVAEVRLKSNFVFAPWFIVEDQDFVDEFPQLKNFYAQYLSVKDLKDILDLPVSQMAKRISELPKGAQESVKTIAASMVKSGAIDSVAKIKKLDEIFETDMEFLSSLLQ